MHRALESVWSRLYKQIDGASFERRGDLFVALYPPLPMLQCNGPWVVEDTKEAAVGLAGAVTEVEAAVAKAMIQTRSGHELAQRAAAELGFTNRVTLPGMTMRPEELASVPSDGFSIDLIAGDEADTANDVLAAAFGAPRELFDAFSAACTRIDGAAWYGGRVDGEMVATALGLVSDGAIGVFNVATSPEYRGRGYGAALTARVARDGFANGATLAYLQSSEMGHGVYRKLGFRDVEEYVLLTRPV
jgi:ribosomal protein S18 acetylase RimI-like enzyme